MTKKTYKNKKSSHILESVKIPCPTKSEVSKYLNIWNNTENLYKPERALEKLFKDYRTNNENNILIKIYALNDAYSVNIRWQVTIAKYIANQKIDADLHTGDLRVVDKIRTGHGVRRKGTDTEINFYSFATKYCGFHNPDKYPLFDSNVKRALRYFKKHNPEFTFNNTDLRVYKAFVDIIQRFQKVFAIQVFSFRDIDKYLYLVGRELNENLPARK